MPREKHPSAPKQQPIREFSQQELARAIGRTTRQVRNLTDQEVFRRVPSEAKPNTLVYPWPESMQLWVDYCVAQSRPDPADNEMEDAELRKAVADAELAELKVAKLRGEVVDRETFRQVLGSVLERVRLRLDAMPGEYASEVLGLSTIAEAVPVIRSIADRVRAELRDVGVMTDDEDDGDDDGQPGEGREAAA